MMRVVISEFVTLDGVFEDPGGVEGFTRGGWAFGYERGPEGDRFKLDEILEADALLLGRRTYEGFAEAWPSRTDESGFADKMNGIQKYVASRTLTKADWNNSTLISGDLIDQVRQTLAQGNGTLLVVGSGSIVRQLVSHDLVDEIRLMVFPTALGTGRPCSQVSNTPEASRYVIFSASAQPPSSSSIGTVQFRPRPRRPSPISSGAASARERRKTMSYQAYLDTIKEKTGLSVGDFQKLADERGLLRPGVKAGEVVTWLKTDHGLGHGHAMAMYGTLRAIDAPKVTDQDRVDKHFSGKRSAWIPAYNKLLKQVQKFGTDVSTQVGQFLHQPAPWRKKVRHREGVGRASRRRHQAEGDRRQRAPHQRRDVELNGHPPRDHHKGGADRSRTCRLAAPSVRQGVSVA